MVTCTICGAQVPSQRKVFCSQTCKRKGDNIRPRVRPRIGYQRRDCEVCGINYQPTYAGQRSCGSTCGMFVRYGWPVASVVRWRQCSICTAAYTARGNRRCTCGWTCTECGAALPTHRAHRRPLCGLCADRNDAVIRDSARHVRRIREMVGRVERVDRFKVFERDKWCCGLCGEKVDRLLKHPHPMSPSLDHVVPLARGGEHNYANVQLAHLVCNRNKKTGGSQQLALLG